MTMYAIISRDEGLLDVVDTTGARALDHAATLGLGNVWFDAPEQWLERSGGSLAANKRRTHAAMRKDPYLALARTGLPEISLEDVLHAYPKRHIDRTDNRDPGLIAAHAALVPHFPSSKTMKAGNDVDVGVWQTPKGMVEHLLGQNAKLKKKPGVDVPRYLKEQLSGQLPPEAWGLSLAPHKLAYDAKLRATAFDDPVARRQAKKSQLGISGTVCFRKTAECSASCLVYTGQNNADRYNYVVKFAKTRALIQEPLAFCRVLLDAVGRQSRRSKIWPFVRLNVFSDVPWELFFPDILRLYPDVWFYDYTKVPGRDPQGVADVDYDLTFSYSGHNKPEMLFELTKMNRRVAVVFATKKYHLPKFAWGVPVVDADISDFRPLDPPNPGTGSRKPVIVGLAYKDPLGNQHAKAAKNLSVFVVPCQEEEDGNIIIHETPGQTPFHALGEWDERRLRETGIKRRLRLV